MDLQQNAVSNVGSPQASAAGDQARPMPRHRTLKKWLLLLLTLVLLTPPLYVAGGAAILSVSISPKRKAYDGDPLAAGVGAVPIQFQSATDDLTLKGFYLPGQKPQAIIMLHGLDGASWRGYHPKLAREYQQHGYHVLLYDMRGHGQSEGDALGLGWREGHDVKGAIQLLMDKGIQPGNIGIHGSSYGGGTALIATSVNPEVGAVVADCPFADFRLLINQELTRRTGFGALFSPAVVWVAHWQYGLELDQIPPLVAVPKIAPRPIFFIHGEKDDRVPADHTRMMIAASHNPLNQSWISPTGHTQGYNELHDEYVPKVIGFFDRYLGAAQ